MTTKHAPCLFAIVSAYHSSNDAVQNVLAHDDLVRHYVRPMPHVFREVTGCWQGEVEQSVQIICPPTDNQEEWLEDVKRIGLDLFEQDAILVVHGDLSANLFYKDGSVDTLEGQWGPLTLHQATRRGAWTFLDGVFYGVS